MANYRRFFSALVSPMYWDKLKDVFYVNKCNDNQVNSGLNSMQIKAYTLAKIFDKIQETVTRERFDCC
jgi:hypothetical protein